VDAVVQHNVHRPAAQPSPAQLACPLIAVENVVLAKAAGKERRTMANPFVHVELNTTDLAKAKDFYGKLLNWELEDVPMGDMGTYTLVKVGEGAGTGGGMMTHPVPGMPSSWLAYVAVDDINASTEKARSLGAHIIRDVTEIPNIGSFSIFADPTGAVLALWKPAPKD
jgi:predicted enzyme related to lactoylglutathione lyase